MSTPHFLCERHPVPTFRSAQQRPLTGAGVSGQLEERLAALVRVDVDVAVVAAGQDQAVGELVSGRHHARGDHVARVSAQRLRGGEADSIAGEKGGRGRSVESRARGWSGDTGY